MKCAIEFWYTTTEMVARVFDRALQLVALVLLVSTAVGAWHDVSQAWDSGYYHLPFAARLAGILPPDVYELDAANRARFEGFPLLGEMLQGLLWRTTGRIECANFVSLLSVPMFAWFLRRRLGVPLHVSTIALFAIPLVQTHATSCYVDLPANVAASVVILLAVEAYSAANEVTFRTLAIACACGAIATNMKVLLHGVVAAAIVALFVRALRSQRPATLGLGFAFVMPVVFATALKNLAIHANPYFPLRWSLFGHAWPGVEDPYSSSPSWLEHAPRSVRFVCSLMEVGIRPMTDPHRWTVDQWMPSDSMGNRMGGFFHAWVVANLVLLAWRALREGTLARRAAIGFAILTVIISIMPQSHELRYWLSWMIVLVSINAWLAARSSSPIGARSFALVATAALAAVVCVTRGAFVTSSGSSFAELLDKKVDTAVIASIRDGQHVRVSRLPWTMLYAAPFHPPRRYVVKEAEMPDDDGSKL